MLFRFEGRDSNLRNVQVFTSHGYDALYRDTTLVGP